MSSDESASEARRAMEPLASQAAAFTAVSARATASDSRVTLRVRPAACSTGRTPACAPEWMDVWLGEVVMIALEATIDQQADPPSANDSQSSQDFAQKRPRPPTG